VFTTLNALRSSGNLSLDTFSIFCRVSLVSVNPAAALGAIGLMNGVIGTWSIDRLVLLTTAAFLLLVDDIAPDGI